MPVLQRDPVSELLDGGARALLLRAMAARGAWVTTRLADPSAAHLSWAASEGIDLAGPDRVRTRSGTSTVMRTRWARGFSRALYYQLKWYGSPGRMRATRRMTPYDRALEIRVGRHRPPLGVIPAGREISIRLMAGGRAARAAVAAKPAAQRIFTPGGAGGDSQSDSTARDWAS